LEATLHPLGNCGMNRNVRGFSDACNRGVVCCGVGGRCRIAGSILMAGDHHIQDRTTIPGPTPTTAFEPTAATRTPGRPATARATAAAAAGLGITSAKTATNQRSMVAALVLLAVALSDGNDASNTASRSTAPPTTIPTVKVLNLVGMSA
jgi:hypothetical protein